VYVAGSLRAKTDVRIIVDVLRHQVFSDVEVVSRWHDLCDAETDADPEDEVTRRALNDMNVVDMDRADVFVVWTATGKPSATYGEIGYGVGRGKRVFWIQGPDRIGSNLFDAHPLVTVVTKLYGGDPLVQVETTPDVAAVHVWSCMLGMIRNGRIVLSEEAR
jgi:hypothetical protein